MPSLTTQEIATALDAKLVGRADLTISRLAHPADLTSASDLALAIDPKLFPLLSGTPIQAAVISAEGEALLPPGLLQAAIVVGRGRFAMAKLTSLFAEPVFVTSGIHPTALIDASAKIGANCTIGAYTIIGPNAEVGANSVIHSQVTIENNAILGEQALIYSGVRIGARVKIGARAIIHYNTTIGADGFSFVTPQMGSVESAKASGAVGATNHELVRIASLGAVIIGDDVEIGANTSIDRGTIISTRVGNGTKIDNQVQIGHNVIVGENCLICGRVGIAGSAEIGNRVVLGGASGVADHVKVGDDAIAMGMSGIAGNIAPKSLVMGAPAKPRDAVIDQMFQIGRLKSLTRKVQKLTERLDLIEGMSETKPTASQE